MTTYPKDPISSRTKPAGRWLDRHAARRASQSIESISSVLPSDSVETLAQDVISRLAKRAQPTVQNTVLAQDLADALVSADDTAGMRLATRALSAGTDIEELLVTYLAGAARILGARWAEDTLTSSQITIAAARMYAIMRGVGATLMPAQTSGDRHAVFATVPGEQHTLGITMAAELFRRDGWLIDLKVGRDHDALLAELAETDFSVLGLSACTPEILPELIRLVAAVRIEHPHVRIVVSGHLAEVEPQLSHLTDADYVSTKLDTLRAVMREFHDTLPARQTALRG